MLSVVRPRLSHLIAMFSLAGTVFANDINTGGQAGIVRSLSTETLGKTGFNIGGAFKYGTEIDYVAGPQGNGPVLESDTRLPVTRSSPHLFSGNVYAAYGLTGFWDIALDMPIYYDITGWDDLRVKGGGDLEITTKMAYPFGRDSAWLTSAYYLKVLLPTGSQERGYFPRHAYYLTGSPLNDTDEVFALKSVYFSPQIIWSIDARRINPRIPLLLHANFGGVVATRKGNSTLVAALGLEYRPIETLTFFTEISGESRVQWYTDYFSINSFINDPFRVTPGMKMQFPRGFYLTLAGDIGVAKNDDDYRIRLSRKGYSYSTKSVPRYSAQITFGWHGIGIKPDRDRDGVEDAHDRCIALAEDIDGFEDSDGCPDPDNDGDGILDARDSCPLEPSTCDGCPVRDGDNDGVKDDVDRCPAEPEDRDAYLDEDGCPDNDNDGDGIEDKSDGCPNNKEDSDGFEDADGCPDNDNDGDGIPDAADKCPLTKGVSENNGCPRTEEIKRGKLILDGVNFESGKAVLRPESYPVLDRVFESLSEWENVRVEIRGHTDNTGSDAVNQRLSQDRAEAVMQYLLQKGISMSRLSAIGFGESAPIADNRKAGGRAQNRRVELRRID